MSDDAKEVFDSVLRVVCIAVGCLAVWSLGLLMYRLAEKFQIETFVMKQMLLQMGVQLP